MSETNAGKSRFMASRHYQGFAESLRRELAPHRLEAMRQVSFFLIRPEALARRFETRIIDYLNAHGLQLLEIESCVHAAAPHFEELYRYNVADATEQGSPATWWLDSLTFLQGPVLTLLLYAEVSDGVDLHDKIVALKGSADPSRGRAGEIRHDFAAENRSLALIHSSDDWLSAAREYLIFHDIERLRENLDDLNRLRVDQSARRLHQEEIRSKTALELATYSFDPALATDFVSVLVRVKLRLLKLARDESRPCLLPTGNDVYLDLAGLAHTIQAKDEKLHRYTELCRKELHFLSSIAAPGSPSLRFLANLADPGRYDLALAEAVVRFLKAHAVFVTEWERIVLMTGMHYPRGVSSGAR